jgi:hypothetical protein
MSTPIKSAGTVIVKTRLFEKNLDEHERVWALLHGTVQYLMERFSPLACVETNIGVIYEFKTTLEAEMAYDQLNMLKPVPLKLTLQVDQYV